MVFNAKKKVRIIWFCQKKVVHLHRDFKNIKKNVI